MSKLAVLNTHPIQYFAPLYRRLAQEPDIDLTVYFCSRQGAEEYVDEGFGERIKWDRSLLEGYEHKFLKNWRTGDRVGGFWSLINPAIVSELRNHRYDALIVNGHTPATYLLGILAAKVLGVTVMMRCDTHLGLQRSAFKQFLRKPLMRFLYNRICGACLPVGTLNKEFYLFHGVNPNRMFTVPFAVDNDYFITAAETCAAQSALKAELGLPSGKPVILFASKLISLKRPMDLVASFQRLQSRGSDAALVFVGSGPDEQALKDYVQEHHVADVHFFGFQNQSQLPKYYATADVFVMASENDSWGLVLNEVMCAGIPIIASNKVGAVRDLVRHGENGFIYESGNIDELSNYLSQLLDDRERCKLMGTQSRRIIEHWDHEYCVRGIKQALASFRRDVNRIVESQAA